MTTNIFDDAQDDFFTRRGAGDAAPPFFVGREKELEAAKTALRTGKHVLFLGPRGVGKTYCIWQIATLLRQESLAGAENGAIPIRSDEDFRDFPDLQEFVLDLFLRFGKEIEPLDRVESLRIVGRGQREQDAGAHRSYTERLLTGPWHNDSDGFFQHVAKDLRDTCRKLGRQGVLFLENMDDFVKRILKNEKGEQERFMRFMEQAHLVLIATSTTFLPAWKRPNGLLGDKFEIFPLKEFSQEESREMLVLLAESQKDTLFQQDITNRVGIMETLYPFTDGNARSLAMCYTAIRAHHGKQKNIRQALSTLLASSTPYYQERFKRRGLNSLRLKLLIHMVRFSKPMSQKGLANKLGEDEAHVRSAMKWLADHHYVKPMDIEGKERRYIIKDTLFRMWMEVRQTPDSLRRITSLISFFETIHEGKNPADGCGQGFGDLPAWETTLEDHSMLEKRFNKVWVQVLPQEVYATAKGFYTSQDGEGLSNFHETVMHNKSLTEADVLKNFETLVAVFLFFLRDFQQANALFETLFQKYTIEDDAVWWVYSRSLFLAQERLQFILAFNERWQKELPGDHLAAYYHHGIVRLMMGEHAQAIEAFDRCLTLKFNNWSVRKSVILANKGQALLLSHRVEEALASCLGAIQIKGGENIPQIHRNLVCIYLTMGNEEKAKEHLLRTVQCLKDHHDSRNLDMSLRFLFQFIDDNSPLVDESVRLVETFVAVTRRLLNRVRIQRLLNDLITSGKLNIAGKIVAVLKNSPYPIADMFQPYVLAFDLFNMPSIRERNEFKKGLLPELRNAVDIILQMVHMTQERG